MNAYVAAKKSKRATAATMRRAYVTSAEEFDVRPSRVFPGLWIVFRRSSGHGVSHPECDGLTHGILRYGAACARCFFKTEGEARDAALAWPEEAWQSKRSRGRRTTAPIAASARKQVRTLAEELEALRGYMAKRDANPWHGWHPCSGAHCECRPGFAAAWSYAPKEYVNAS